MTSSADHVKADPEQLRAMAGQLKTSTSALDEAAGSAPPMPEVTVSADKVGHTLAEISKTVAGLITGVHDTADHIHASDGSYDEVDNVASDTLQRSGEGLPPH